MLAAGLTYKQRRNNKHQIYCWWWLALRVIKTKTEQQRKRKKRKSNGQNRVHPEARWLKPGTPFHASPRAPSYWPTPAQTRLWPNLKRVHPTLAIHPPIGYPISITRTRLWPGYSTSSPHAHASSRHRGTRRVIFVDVVVRAAEL